MRLLETKVQYKNYEPGEFTEIKNRSFEETIQLIKNYPWHKERHMAHVELTCPSITIESSKGDFIKLAPYFNDKYCIYVFTKKGDLLIKKYLKPEDAYQDIEAIFNSDSLPYGLVPYAHHSTHVKHFKTNHFVYTVTGKRILEFTFFRTIIMNIAFISIFLGGQAQMSITIALIALLIVWPWLGGMQLAFFINYYFFSRRLYLQVSKNKDAFIYGTVLNNKSYNKSDIQLIKYQRPVVRKYNPCYNNERFEIFFKNGQILKFPNLLIDASDFLNKFDKIPIKYIETDTPFMLRKYHPDRFTMTDH